MKVAINIQADIQEIEVIINCMAEDENVQSYENPDFDDTTLKTLSISLDN